MEKFDALLDFVERAKLNEEWKIELQRKIVACRSEFLYENAKAKECAAKQDVYADVCNKMISQLADRCNRGEY